MFKKKILAKFGYFILSLALGTGLFNTSLSTAYALPDQQFGESINDTNLTLSKLELQSIANLAIHCGFSEQKLKNTLCFRALDKPCILVPVCNCKEHRDCFLRIFSYANPDYMKYYLSGRLQSHNYVNSWFSRSVKNTNQSLPQSMTFLIKTGDRVIGRVGIGPLRNRKGADAEIGYAIEQSYSGKGITKKAVKTLLSFLEQLRYYNRCYNFKRIRAVTKPENKASNSILASCGFILSKNPVNSKFGVKNEYFYYF